jgi:glycosyltransferase involved in cell wall biosynthesis
MTGPTPRAEPRANGRNEAKGLRLAMVTTRFPPLLGGIETHVDEVARRMAGRGLDVTVLTTDVSGRLLPREDREGLSIRRFRAGPRGTDLHASLSLIRELASGGYDLVHVQGLHTLLPPMTLRASQRAGIRTVVSFHTGGHSSRLRTAIREPQWQALRPLLRRSDALVAVCAYEVEQFARRLRIDPQNIRLIRNGADALPFDDHARPVAAGSPLIGSVGRLERYKGHHRLIAAMPALLEMAPDARLAIVGRGSYERQLRRLVTRLGVEPAVTFISFGSEERAALGALIRSSDVVALLSDYEANPVALMEALALGRKVVVADTSGLTELAADGLATAIAVDTSPARLAQVLVSVAAAQESPTFHLPTWDHCVDELLQVYAETVANPR